MKLSTIIKSILDEKKLSVAELARRVNQTPQNLGKKLNNDTLSFNEFQILLKALNVKANVSLEDSMGSVTIANNESQHVRDRIDLLEMELAIERKRNSYLDELNHDYVTALSSIAGLLGIASSHLDDSEKLTQCIAKMNQTYSEIGEMLHVEGDGQTYPIETLKGKKFLIVDDNKINRGVIADQLGEAGILSVEASDGYEAMDLLEDERNHIDFILLDLRMPKLSGYTTASKIRRLQNGRFSNVIIIGMSASSSLEEKDKIKKSGMNGFIEKPFTIGKLFGELKADK